MSSRQVSKRQNKNSQDFWGFVLELFFCLFVFVIFTKFYWSKYIRSSAQIIMFWCQELQCHVENNIFMERKKMQSFLQSTIALSLPQLMMLLVKALVPDALKSSNLKHHNLEKENFIDQEGTNWEYKRPYPQIHLKKLQS